jgi:hypothetical protein
LQKKSENRLVLNLVLGKSVRSVLGVKITSGKTQVSKVKRNLSVPGLIDVIGLSHKKGFTQRSGETRRKRGVSIKKIAAFRRVRCAAASGYAAFVVL